MNLVSLSDRFWNHNMLLSSAFQDWVDSEQEETELKTPIERAFRDFYGPEGIRTPVAGMRARYPRPLDDGTANTTNYAVCIPPHQDKEREIQG